MDDIQRKIYECTFSMLAKLAAVDGSVSEDEVKAVNRFIRDVLKLPKDKKKLAVKIFIEARKSTGDFHSLAKEYSELLAEKPKMYLWMIDVMLAVSAADGHMSRDEERMICEACREFAVSPDTYRELRSRYIKSDDSAYQVLGCSKADPIEKIKEAYRRKLEEFSPERLVALGLPEEFAHSAEEKQKTLETAFQQIRHERGLI